MLPAEEEEGEEAVDEGRRAESEVRGVGISTPKKLRRAFLRRS